MSNFEGAAKGCFAEASNILSAIRSELNNWNDVKAKGVKDYVENSRKSFQSVCTAAGKVDNDIKKMQEIAVRVESISRKTTGNGI